MNMMTEAAIQILDLFPTASDESFGALVAVSGQGGVIRKTILELTLPSDATPLIQHRMTIPPTVAGWKMAVSNQSASVLLAGDGGILDIWTRDGLMRRYMTHRGNVTGICGRGELPAVFCTDLGLIAEIDASGQVVELGKCTVGLTAIAADDSCIVVSAPQGKCYRYDYSHEQITEIGIATADVELTCVALLGNGKTCFGASDGAVYKLSAEKHVDRTTVSEGSRLTGVGTWATSIWTHSNAVRLIHATEVERLSSAPWTSMRTICRGGKPAEGVLFGCVANKLGYWNPDGGAWMARQLDLGNLAVPYSDDSCEDWDDWMPSVLIPTTRHQAVEFVARRFGLDDVSLIGDHDATICIANDYWWFFSKFGLGSLIVRHHETGNEGGEKSYQIYPVRRVMNASLSGKFLREVEIALMEQRLWQPFDLAADEEPSSEMVVGEFKDGRNFVDEHPRFTVNIATGGQVTFQPAIHPPSRDTFDELLGFSDQKSKPHWRSRDCVHIRDLLTYGREIQAVCRIEQSSAVQHLIEALQ